MDTDEGVCRARSRSTPSTSGPGVSCLVDALTNSEATPIMWTPFHVGATESWHSLQLFASPWRIDVGVKVPSFSSWVSLSGDRLPSRSPPSIASLNRRRSYLQSILRDLGALCEEPCQRLIIVTKGAPSTSLVLEVTGALGTLGQSLE